MALISPQDETPGKIAEALGLRMCRSLVLRMGVDEAVTVTAEQYVEKPQLDNLLHELQTTRYLLVPIKDEEAT